MKLPLNNRPFREAQAELMFVDSKTKKFWSGVLCGLAIGVPALVVVLIRSGALA